MPKQRTALDMIKQQEGHGGMSPEALLLHEKQAEDAERMEMRMCEIERKVDNLDRKFDDLDKKMDEIKKIVTANGSFIANVKNMFCNKVFIYLLLSLVAIKFGIPTAELGAFLFK